MIAIKINNHFIVHQFGNATGVLPVNTQPDIGLLHFIIVIINNNVDAALQSIFYKFFNRGKFQFSNLRHIFSQPQTILTKVAVEIFCLVIFPLEFLVLHTVLSKFYGVYLCCSFHRKENGKAGHQA